MSLAEPEPVLEHIVVLTPTEAAAARDRAFHEYEKRLDHAHLAAEMRLATNTDNAATSLERLARHRDSMIDLAARWWLR